MTLLSNLTQAYRPISQVWHKTTTILSHSTSQVIHLTQHVALYVAKKGCLLFSPITQSDDCQKYFKPFYERTIKPLEKKDLAYLIGAPAAAVALSAAAFYLIGPLACTLTSLVTSIAAGILMTIPFSHLRTLHEKEAIPYLERIQEGINKNNYILIEKQLSPLEDNPKFQHLKEKTTQLRKEFTHFKEHNPPTKKQKDAFYSYIKEFIAAIRQNNRAPQPAAAIAPPIEAKS